jgi:hypothetical protein
MQQNSITKYASKYLYGRYVNVTLPSEKGIAMKKGNGRFATVMKSDVPHSRNGKHKELISKILAEIADLNEGEALRIELAALKYSKEKVRSALNRAGHKLNRQVATATDAEFLYVWSTTH